MKTSLDGLSPHWHTLEIDDEGRGVTTGSFLENGDPTEDHVHQIDTFDIEDVGSDGHSHKLLGVVSDSAPTVNDLPPVV